jgi:amino acid permease
MTTLSNDISYSMFSEVGNLAVHGVVVTAITMNLTWPQTYKCLRVLANSNPDMFGEAMDTAVRECVYDACGFTSDFYGA